MNTDPYNLFISLKFLMILETFLVKIKIYIEFILNSEYMIIFRICL